jgi:ribosomal protein L21E
MNLCHIWSAVCGLHLVLALIPAASGNAQTNQAGHIETARPQIKFKNKTEESISVFWVPAKKPPSNKHVVKAGESLSQLTTIGHEFLVKSDSVEMRFVACQSIQEITIAQERTDFDLQGWTLSLSNRLWKEKPKRTRRMLELMTGQLARVAAAVPVEPLKHLRSVKIWINPEYEGVRPTAEYHGNVGWLKNNKRDPEMAKCVEITNVERFEFENTRMPYVMLHELSHAYHDQVLGFRNVEIRKQFETAKASGVYDNVDRFTGRKIVKDKAYALSNEKEYFAESTEAYFGKNDFFPFDRKELKANDLGMHNLVAKLWQDESQNSSGSNKAVGQRPVK